MPAAAAPDGQWYLNALHVRQAQKISTGKGVTIAVIDSGIDNTRPALKGQVLDGKCFASARDIEPTWDPNGHGTAMAGLIAGDGSDRRHILGVAPGAKLMPLCLSGANVTDNALFEGIAPAVRYAVDHGAKIINLSLGAYEKHAEDVTVAKLHSAIRYAEQHDVLLVAGAGNRGQDNEGIISPASIPGVIAVGGTDQRGESWAGSIEAKQVALAAPSEHLLTTNTGTVEDLKHGPRSTSGYQIVDGTSAATALVSGAAALVRAKYPTLDAANVINRLIKTADHKGAPGRNPQYGYGIVDPVKALTAHVDPVKSNPLGQLDAPAAGSSSSKAAAAPAETSSSGNVGVWIAVGAAVLAIIIVLIIVLAVRARRRKAVAQDGWRPGGQPTRGPGQTPRASLDGSAAASPGQPSSGPPGVPARPVQATPPTGAPPATGSTQPGQPSGQQGPPGQYEIRWREP
jgi:type VII secretion-associated serine protease mycosin